MLPTLALLLLLCHAASAAPAPYNATAAGAPRLYSETCVCPSSAPECKAEGFGFVGTKKCFQPHDIFGTSGVECTRDDGTAMACTHSRDEACHWSCDSTAIGNGICNQACSTAACLKDGGDCGESDPYTCSGCTALGYKWCPTAALCAKYTETVTARHGDRELCPEDAWVDACDAKYDTLSDPLYEPNQWVFDLVRVEPVWAQGITGEGVTININDLGPFHEHPDFASKYDEAASCPGSEYNMGDHGTTTAAIALASANDECSRGIAYGAGLSKCSFRTNSNEENLLFAFSDYALQTNAVSSNSWGIPPCLSHERLRQNKMACPFRPVAATSPDPRFPSPCEVCTSWVPGSCDSRIQRYCSHPSNYETDPECAAWTHLWMQCSFQHLDPTTVTYFMRGVHTGRGGLGTVYVFAAGNGHGGGDDINQMGYQHDRFTITTGATDKFGRHSYYSTTGASLFISAPGGDAYDHANNWMVAANGGGCAAQGQGTSYACPVVSGVVALMLEAAPQLTYRDVQGILAQTSYMTDPDDEGWTTNEAGYHHNVKYGFGMVDAQAAVEAAQSWEPWGPEVLIEAHGMSKFRLPLTTAGCVCKQTWTKTDLPDSPVDNFCGRPDGSAEEWCYVTDAACQGESWGYCAQPAPASTVVPHDGTTLVHTLEVGTTGGFFTEWIEVYLYLDHTSRGDLQVELMSPSGTNSVLMPAPRPEDSNPAPTECSPSTDSCATRNDGICDNPTSCACDYNDCSAAGWIGSDGAPSLRHPTFNWKMTTVRSWGEDPAGTWTLAIKDTQFGSAHGPDSQLYSWDLHIFGH